ncbi:uncharacterized protein E0L32_001390 [Thyridium curvatum]|uniref:Mitochondrial ribosomal protein L27 n=1 Tax=Thyridium curvatum TaxID=1093900 RepID=A0A507AQX1_9PEZI|nr:uncharacterized protein E0L32_001390 [Thyridium curvatum]TPX10193.1 hypothetical protein E0L32_001390 [Thyridium curvatum]
MRPTQILCRHYRKLRLTTKDVNKGFYKGTGTGSMGRHTKHGGYVIEYHKVRTYVVPEGLADFKLTPFVTQQMRPTYGSYKEQGDDKGPRSPTAYLERWKAENGFD